MSPHCPTHFFGVMLARATGLELTPVPYKGGGPLVSDLIGGRVPAGITALSELTKQHESGKLRVLGLEPVGSTPDELAKRIAEDTARWAPVVKASGFRADE